MAVISMEFLLAALCLSAFASLAICAEKAALEKENLWGISLGEKEDSLSCSAIVNMYYANSGGELRSTHACRNLAGGAVIAETFSEGGIIHVKIEEHYGR